MADNPQAQPAPQAPGGPSGSSASRIGTTNQLIGAVIPSIALALLMLSAFCLIHRKWLDVYQPKTMRLRLTGYRSFVPPTITGSFFSVLWNVRRTGHESIANHVGSDALIFTGFLEFGLKTSFWLTLIGVVVLAPLNYIGGNGAKGLDMLSASNIRDKSPLLWVHTASVYVFTSVFMFYTWRLCKRCALNRQRFLLGPYPQSCSILLRDIPKELKRTEVLEFFTDTIAGPFLHYHPVEDTKHYRKIKKKKNDVILKLERLECHSRAKGERPTTRINCFRKKVDAIDYYKGLLDKYNTELSTMQAVDRPGAPIIIAFGSKVDANFCKAGPASNDLAQFIVDDMPSPRSLIWENLLITEQGRIFRALGSVLLTTLFIVGYAAAVSIIAALANLKSLARVLPFLDPVLRLSPPLTSFIQGFLPPLALSIFASLVPWFMRQFSIFEGNLGLGEAETSAIFKVYMFLVFDVFLAYTIAGSFFTKIDAFKSLASNPPKLATLLASTIPSQSTFYMTYIILGTFSTLPGELLRIGPAIITKLKRRYLAKSVWDHLSALIFYIHFDAAYAFPLVVKLAGICYSSIAPIISPFVFLYFCFAYCVYTNQLTYVYDTPYELGGAQWPIIFKCICISLVIYQILMIGLLGLKRMPIAAAVLVPLVILTIYFYLRVSKSLNLLVKLLSRESIRGAGGLSAASIERHGESFAEALKNAYLPFKDRGDNTELSEEFRLPLLYPYEIEYKELDRIRPGRTLEEMEQAPERLELCPQGPFYSKLRVAWNSSSMISQYDMGGSEGDERYQGGAHIVSPPTTSGGKEGERSPFFQRNFVYNQEMTRRRGDEGQLEEINLSPERNQARRGNESE